VLAIDLIEANLVAARTNARRNGVAGKLTTVHADGFTPLDAPAAEALAGLDGRVGFLVANPPGDAGDDGLGWRRRVLASAAPLLSTGAPVLLQISRQYGRPRIAGLAGARSPYRYEGLVAESTWEPFDLARRDLAELLRRYADVERSGGLPYVFRMRGETGAQDATAVDAIDAHKANGSSPVTKWQLHLYRRR
jgi:hypothetical protein